MRHRRARVANSSSDIFSLSSSVGARRSSRMDHEGGGGTCIALGGFFGELCELDDSSF